MIYHILKKDYEKMTDTEKKRFNSILQKLYKIKKLNDTQKLDFALLISEKIITMQLDQELLKFLYLNLSYILNRLKYSLMAFNDFIIFLNFLISKNIFFKINKKYGVKGICKLYYARFIADPYLVLRHWEDVVNLKTDKQIIRFTRLCQL